MPELHGPRRPPRGEAPPHLRAGYLALVFVGGMGGTLARFGLSEVLPTPSGVPLGIFLINIAGAFALGLLLEALARRGPDIGRRRALRLLLGTGFLGGFTTYSALAVDSALLLGGGAAAAGLGYLVVSVLMGLGATALGIAAGRLVRRRTPTLAGGRR
ncbi:CrcB family protein [Arthrobacter sp. TMS1-12-1]